MVVMLLFLLLFIVTRNEPNSFISPLPAGTHTSQCTVLAGLESATTLANVHTAAQTHSSNSLHYGRENLKLRQGRCPAACMLHLDRSPLPEHVRTRQGEIPDSHELIRPVARSPER